MKKIALAPAVALAITGFAAAPVFAAPNSDAFGLTNVQVAQNGEQTEPDASQTETPDETFDPSVKVSPSEITQSELVEPGVTITVSNLEAGDVVTDSLTGESVEAEGETVEFSIVNVTGDPTAVPAGPVEFTVTVQRGEETKSIDVSFTVVDDEAEEPTVDPKATLETNEITVSEFTGEGLKFSGEGFTPNGTISIEGAAVPGQAGTQAAAQAEDELVADENGNITGAVVAPEEVEPGKYTVTFVDDESGETTEALEFTVTEDETEEPTTPVAEAKLTVSPETVTPADFVNQDKGVTLAVENCEPGADVHFLVNPKGDSNVTAYDNTVEADDEGKASVVVYGTSASDPSAYIGDYDVTVTCGDEELSGEFSVAEDANAGGSDGNDDGAGNGGGDLPRTGMELSGLAAGTALLLVGGAVVTMTKRRRKAAVSPSEI